MFGFISRSLACFVAFLTPPEFESETNHTDYHDSPELDDETLEKTISGYLNMVDASVKKIQEECVQAEKENYESITEFDRYRLRFSRNHLRAELRKQYKNYFRVFRTNARACAGVDDYMSRFLYRFHRDFEQWVRRQRHRSRRSLANVSVLTVNKEYCNR